MDKLKPCPICGGTEFVFFETPSKDGSIVWHKILHLPQNPCSISLLGSDKQKVIEQWNTRADDQRTVKLLEALEAEIVARRNSIRVWSLNEFLPVLEAIVEEYKQAEKESPN